MDLLPPYGSVFPFAPAERSWVWILLELSPHVGGAQKKKKKEEERNLVFSGDRGSAMTASFSRLCPLETRWWAYTSRDWLSPWPFITASLDPSGNFVPYPEGIPWLRPDWWTRMYRGRKVPLVCMSKSRNVLCTLAPARNNSSLRTAHCVTRAMGGGGLQKIQFHPLHT